MLKDASILITGGTGSFGRALARRLLALEEGPQRIVVLSRDELKQHQLTTDLTKHDPGERMRYFIGDVRDADRLKTAFRGVDYVIHAAAMKQVPACEYNPTEAIRTNVEGAVNVVNAAIEAGVKSVLALSTDKAVNPANLYGATKACAERLFVHANSLAGSLDTRFSCVRYGNVLGSRGSVLQVWRDQKAIGQKLTLTDPLMTRFWITMTQAVQFVLESLERMQGGEIWIPKLPSVTMADMADAVAQGGGWERIPVRQGEKVHEVLLGPDESRWALDAGDRYVILGWRAAPNALQGRHLPAGFTYASDTNRQRLSGPALELLLQEVP